MGKTTSAKQQAQKLLERSTRVPVSAVTKPFDSAIVFMNRYWLLSPDNEILIWRGISPQCNAQKEVVAHWQSKCGLQFMFLEIAYLPDLEIGLNPGCFASFEEALAQR